MEKWWAALEARWRHLARAALLADQERAAAAAAEMGAGVAAAAASAVESDSPSSGWAAPAAGHGHLLWRCVVARDGGRTGKGVARLRSAHYGLLAQATQKRDWRALKPCPGRLGSLLAWLAPLLPSARSSRARPKKKNCGGQVL